jgi:hypothetical protein
MVTVFSCSSSFAQKKRDCLHAFCDTIASVAQIGFKSHRGKIIIPATYKKTSSDRLCSFVLVSTYSGKTFAIDKAGTILWEPFWYDRKPDAEKEGLFRVISNDLVGFANKSGKMVIHPSFVSASYFSEGLAAVNVGGKVTRNGEYDVVEGGLWGYINRIGQLVIAPQFLTADEFLNGQARVTTKELKSISINKDGKPR